MIKKCQDIRQAEPGLVTFYDIWPENGAGLFSQQQSSSQTLTINKTNNQFFTRPMPLMSAN